MKPLNPNQKQFIEGILTKFEISPQILWDRYFFDEHTRTLSIYGWISRTKDSYKDFCQLDFVFHAWFTNKIPIVRFAGTSSSKYSAIISHKLFGHKTPHNKCARVEHFFNVANKVILNMRRQNI